MHIPGHLAIALAQHRLPALSTDNNLLKPLLLASLFPDVIDKSLGYGFRVMPNGRHYAHNIFSLLGTTAFVTAVWGKKAGYAWLAGYLGHLLADRNSLVPWLFPLQSYDFKEGRFYFNKSQFLKELLFLLIAIVFYRLAP
ncbi:MAG: metal-dependent hydrolase [Anaerolineae bacterium]|nr:metal-dependent hydrolase [Anaerolineae bacterium]